MRRGKPTWYLFSFFSTYNYKIRESCFLAIWKKKPQQIKKNKKYGLEQLKCLLHISFSKYFDQIIIKDNLQVCLWANTFNVSYFSAQFVGVA